MLAEMKSLEITKRKKIVQVIKVVKKSQFFIKDKKCCYILNIRDNHEKN